MNISVKSLKDFKDFASGLKSANVLPIFEFIRFQKGTTTKVTGEGFFVYKCPEVDTDMLVDEKLLYVKLANTSAEALNFTKKGNKVTITDGITPTSFQVPDIKEWPKMQDYGEGEFTVSPSFNSALKKAVHFSDPAGAGMLFTSFVMVGKNFMCASDTFITFYHPIEEEFQLVIDAKQAHLLTQIPILKIGQTDDYQFYFNFKGVYGFRKQSIGFFNMTRQANVGDRKVSFPASKSDFQVFNNEAIGSSKNNPWVTMKEGKLSMIDSSLDIAIERPLEYLKDVPSFTYNPLFMNRLLKSFNSDELEFYKDDNWYWIKSPNESHTTLIMRMIDQNS